MSEQRIHTRKRKRAEITETNNEPLPIEQAERPSTTTHRQGPPQKMIATDVSPVSQQYILAKTLRRMAELTAELAALDDSYDTDDNSDSGNDQDDENELMAFEPEALGFAMCARETMIFLAAQGLNADNPLVLDLRKRLVGKCRGLQI